MTTDQILRMIDEYKSGGMVRLGITGGEPTLREDLGEIIRYSTSNGILTSIFSNGACVPDRLSAIRNVKVYLTTIDGTESYHDYQRGDGAFGNAIAGIEAVSTLNIPIITYTVLTRHNLNQVDEVLQLAQRHGFISMFVLVFKHWRSFSRIQEELSPTDEETIGVFSHLLQAKKSGAPVANSRQYLEYMASGRKQLPFCRSGNLFCSVDPRGNVAPCGPRLGDKHLHNGLEIGFLEAFQRAPRPECPRHYCVTGLETSFLFSLHPSAIWNVLFPPYNLS